jgi:serine/threonine protein kinase
LKKAGGVSLLTSIEIAKQLCAGLQYAHAQGILHRDLKPGNIMITWNNGHPFVKIVDFSVAKLHDEETIIAQTALESANESDNKNIEMQALNIPFDKVRDVVGTPAYMSPEQIMARDLDQRSDLYSFGCVLFQMLAGMPPYHGKNAVQTVFKQLNEDAPTLASVAPGRSFPQELENIVAKLLKKNPDHRYRNAGELMDDLNLAFAAVSEKESQLPERKKKEFLSYKKSPSSFSSVSPKLAIALLLLFCCMSFIVYDVVRINSVASKNHAHKTSKTPTDKSARVKSSK